VMRHCESELSERGVVNGDPSVPCGLSAAGRTQAHALAAALAGDPVDLAVTSRFRRTIETAELALTGRDVTRMTMPELDDLHFGEFEGRSLAEYRTWAHRQPVSARPGGDGESRVDGVRRYCRALRQVLALPDHDHVLVVAHGLPLAYVVRAAAREELSDQVDPLEKGAPHRFASGDLHTALGRLESWTRACVA
ncbi:MAG: histidine phosphatase family protein, partial [Actinomycetes bacterium]